MQKKVQRRERRLYQRYVRRVKKRMLAAFDFIQWAIANLTSDT